MDSRVTTLNIIPFQKGGFLSGVAGTVGLVPLRRHRVGRFPDRPVRLDGLICSSYSDFKTTL